jgi:RNA polymerase sigma-70 factor (ECF subfamily)
VSRKKYSIKDFFVFPIVLIIGGEKMETESSVCTDKELEEIYKRNVNMIYRLCYMYLKNTDDAEDAVQSIFLKLLKANNYEHEKAWLIVTTKNHCKDILKSWWKKRHIDFEHVPELSYRDDPDQSGVLEELLSLPEKYKTVLYLYYYEGYSVKEISNILSKKESTIQTQLATGRKHLKISLGGQYERHSYS